MATAQLGLVLRHVRRLVDVRGTEDFTDGQLLERFAARRDGPAFEALLRRHGPLVLDVCRRVLGNIHDAEDAFQATFLVLAHKARSIRKRDSVGSWLYGVAYRLAVRARARAARRRSRERHLTHGWVAGHAERWEGSEPRAATANRQERFAETDPMQTDPVVEVSSREACELLDDELCRLPEKYRAPLVLCYLEGRTNAEAAVQLGWAEGTLKSRILRGRELLRVRLSRRGVALSGAALATLLTAHQATATVPPVLLSATAQAALCFTAGHAAAGTVSAEAVALTKGLLKFMILGKLKAIVVVSLTLGLLGMGATSLVHQTAAAHAARPPDQPAAQDERAAGDGPRQAAEKATPTDRYDDPLPPGALARMGTVRWRHGKSVSFVSFLDAGRTLLTADYDETLRVWDVATGRELRRFKAPPSPTGYRSGGVLVGGGARGGRAVAIFAPPVLSTAGGDFFRVALSADRSTLVSCSANSMLHVWELATGKELRHFPVGQNMVTMLALSADGKQLATSGIDGGIDLWDTATGKRGRRLGRSENRVAAFGTSSTGLAFSPDDSTLVSTAMELVNQKLTASLIFWDLATGQERHRLTQERNGFGEVVFAPDGTVLATISTDGVRFLDPGTGQERQRLAGPPAAGLAFAPDGKTVVTRSAFDQSLQVWEVTTGKKVRSLSGPQPRARGLFALFNGLSPTLAFAPDGKILAVGGDNHAVRLLDATTGQELKPLGGHLRGLASVQFGPDSKTLTSHGDDGTLRVWDATSGRELRQVPVPAGAAAVLLSDDGRTLATGEVDSTIRLWDAATGKELHKFEEPKNGFSGFAFAPDGKVLAVRTLGDRTVRLIDVVTGKDIRRLGTAVPDNPQNAGLALPLSRGAALVFAPDGKMLAILTQPNILELWDVSTGSVRGSIRLSPGQVIRAAAFTPDGRSLAVCAGDETVSLWEVATGELRRHYGQVPKAGPTVGGGAQIVRAMVLGQPPVAVGAVGGKLFSSYVQRPANLVFSPNGMVLAHGRSNQVIVLWDLITGRELCQLRGHQGEVAAVAFAADGKTLASGSADTTALVWDVAGLLRRAKSSAGDLTSQQVEAYWTDLAGGDAAKAFEALGALAAAPRLAVPYLREQLRPAPAADAGRIAQWIADLDSNRFKVRQNARVELEKLGELAAPALREVLKGQPSAETRKRVEELLEKSTGRSNLAGERLRSLRAVEALERIATPDARQVLKTLAAGAPGALQTLAAQEALERLARQEARRM
jgi:RNA polymerase sigma factor (sigma-70 family)